MVYLNNENFKTIKSRPLMKKWWENKVLLMHSWGNYPHTPSWERGKDIAVIPFSSYLSKSKNLFFINYRLWGIFVDLR